jgi:hypothetical protein
MNASQSKSPTIRLHYSKRDHGFRGPHGLLIPADSNERNRVIHFLSRRIEDNPALRYRLGILGAESYRIV